jgi:hypothetical protein
MNFNDLAIKLSEGAHSNPQDGMCIMECVAYIEGEKHTDHPKCACPVVTSFAIRTNDWMNGEERQLLLPFVLRIAGSKSSLEVEKQRAFMAADYAVRKFAPIALRVQKLEAQAKMLESCDKIVDKKTALKGKAAAAAYAADATAVAAYAAYATADAATNAAYAAADAADAAAVYATYAAADAAAVYKELVESRLQLLDDMLKLTDQVEETPVICKKLQELEVLTGG